MNKPVWKKVGDSYLLTSSEEELIRLNYRVGNACSFAISKMEYSAERKGFWSQHYEVIQNGIKTATLSFNFWGSKGHIQFEDGTRYQSNFTYKNVLTLKFTEGDSEILRYYVNGEPGKQYAAFSLGMVMLDADKLLIMAALGMILFLSIFNEFNSDGGDVPMVIVVSA